MRLRPIDVLVSAVDFLGDDHSANVYYWASRLRKNLAFMIDAIIEDWDPYIAAWLGYAYGTIGTSRNDRLTSLLNRTEKWLQEEDVWQYHRNLGPIAWYITMRREQKAVPELENQLIQNVLSLKDDAKYYILHDPEQVYLLAGWLALTRHEQVRKRIMRVAEEQQNFGTTWRQILYKAALQMLGGNPTPPENEINSVADAIAFLWWNEKYDWKRERAWEQFLEFSDQVAVDANELFEKRVTLLIPEKALLFESAVQEIFSICTLSLIAKIRKEVRND